MLWGDFSRKSDLRHGNVEVLDVGKGGGRWQADRVLVTWVDRMDVVGAVLV